MLQYITDFLYLKKHMPYSPQINTGLPGLNIPATRSPFSLYSDKKVISSSMPVRERITSAGINADEMEQQLREFEQASANDVVLNALKNRKY